MDNSKHQRSDKRSTKGSAAKLRRIKYWDRFAAGVIKTGGLVVIVAVIGILALIVGVALPLFSEPESAKKLQTKLPGQNNAVEALAIGLGDWIETSYAFNRDGSFTFYQLDNVLGDSDTRASLEAAKRTEPLRPGRHVKSVSSQGQHQLSVLWDDGTTSLERVHFHPQFDRQGRRTIRVSNTTLATWQATETDRLQLAGSAQVDDLQMRTNGSRLLRAALLEQNKLLVETRSQENSDDEEDDLFGFDDDDANDSADHESPSGITNRQVIPLRSAPPHVLSVAGNGESLIVGSGDGSLLRITIDEDGGIAIADEVAKAMSAAISSVGFVFGDASIAVADRTGRFANFSVVQGADGARRLSFIRHLQQVASQATAVVASVRNKVITTVDAQGEIFIDYPTSERRLFSLNTNAPIATVALAPRGNGIAALTKSGDFHLWTLDAPHPETSWKTLFRQVWYENYNEPAFVWQSTGGTDEFEPKLSLVPLVFGTMKATLYAMLFAVPLGIFAAIYVNQFSTPFYRSWIKPGVEMMAALPSVVIGFLVALWLAPLMQGWIVAVFVFLLVMPAGFALHMFLWQRLRHLETAKKLERGHEFLCLIPVILICAFLAVWVASPLERSLFQGDFSQWIYQTLGARYDQRNSIIIAFGLGIAVIPIIFSISEDSLSQVPKSLAASSLALGASRWQTVWRIVVPSASPGIFAATMIGLGRAVGETMIVLMATGNTPIMDWSPFNGMRTLSANIAVEVPEAPVDGTLYRTLFLCAVILFAMTFALNTIAELVRHRLREKYGRH